MSGPKGEKNVFSDDDDEKEFLGRLGWDWKSIQWDATPMPWNTIHRKDWKRWIQIGKGSYGAVFIGIRDDSQVFAVKSLNIPCPVASQYRAQRNEVTMMKLLRSPYIVRCLGCGRSRGENGLNKMETLDVFMEYCPRGSLRYIMESRKTPFEEDPYIRQYTYDILQAIAYMHRTKVVHGDIKAANLLLTDDCVKLADWGGAKKMVCPESIRKIVIGTTGFKSPEVVAQIEQSYPADVFSLGCTVLELATAEYPETISTWVTGYDYFLKPIGKVKSRRPDIPSMLSDDCRDFVIHCLCQKAEDRWTAAELLQHPFVYQRDQSNKMPYDMPIPNALGRNLLQAPPRVYDKIPDPEPLTKRTWKHLVKGQNAQPHWLAGLLGCGSNDPPLYPSSPRSPQPNSPPRSPGSAQPLPLFQPDIHPQKSNLTFLSDKCPNLAAALFVNVPKPAPAPAPARAPEPAPSSAVVDGENFSRYRYSELPIFTNLSLQSLPEGCEAPAVDDPFSGNLVQGDPNVVVPALFTHMSMDKDLNNPMSSRNLSMQLQSAAEMWVDLAMAHASLNADVEDEARKSGHSALLDPVSGREKRREKRPIEGKSDREKKRLSPHH